MQKINLAFLAGGLGIVLMLLSRKTESAAIEYSDESFMPEPENDFLGVFMGKGNSAMRDVDLNLINHPQIQAFLRVIRRGEGTADSGGYNRLFGGGSFSDLSWHPGIYVKASGYTSSAAGAYQFLKSTWDETARLMGLTDFSPLSQDLAALGRIAYRGAIQDVLDGDFNEALKKTSREWASLPYSPYGQPTISLQTALNTFTMNGGTVTG